MTSDSDLELFEAWLREQDRSPLAVRGYLAEVWFGGTRAEVSGNTRARSNRLRMIAAEIIQREHINDPSELARVHIAELVQRGQCHEVTARTVFHAVLAAMRWGRTYEAYSRRQKPEG